jgi:hypothetical protein
MADAGVGCANLEIIGSFKHRVLQIIGVIVKGYSHMQLACA